MKKDAGEIWTLNLLHGNWFLTHWATFQTHITIIWSIDSKWIFFHLLAKIDNFANFWANFNRFFGKIAIKSLDQTTSMLVLTMAQRVENRLIKGSHRFESWWLLLLLFSPLFNFIIKLITEGGNKNFLFNIKDNFFHYILLPSGYCYSTRWISRIQWCSPFSAFCCFTQWKYHILFSIQYFYSEHQD